MNILYLEDNPNDAKLVQRYVDTTGHQLTIVQNISEIEELLPRVGDFDLIMVDILINNKRVGYELASWLRESGFTRPLVAVTALDSPDEKTASTRAGFDAMLIKPFAITALVDLFHQFG